MKTSPTGANVIIRTDVGIVLVEENQESYDRILDCTWALPGGGVEDGETPLSSIVRESWEETGVIITPPRLLGEFIQLAQDGNGGFVKGPLFLYESQGWLSGELRKTSTLEIKTVRECSFDEVLSMKDQIGFGYFNMILQYMRCMDGLTPIPFNDVRLGVPLEYPPWGLRGKQPLVLQT